MDNNKKRKAVELQDSNETGIAGKLEEITENSNNISKKVEEISQQIEEKRMEIQRVHTNTNALDELIRFYEQKDQLQQQLIQLQTKDRQLQQQLIQLQIKDRQLRDQFGDGEYYAFTSSYWEICEVIRKGNEWRSFVREFGENERFQCRYAKGQNATTTDPYETTREGAFEEKYIAPEAGTARTSSMPQSDATARDVVWPTDIFGNEAVPTQEIAHIIPAGGRSHTHWLNVACAALGIDRSANIKVKKKAARGYIKDDNNAPMGEEQGVASNASNLSMGDSAKKKKSRRKEGTGVVHFVTNKIRLLGQNCYLDGKNPTCLIVPVMTLDDAKSWRGEGYTAVCFVGMPRGTAFGAVNHGAMYKGIGLADSALMRVHHTRDAKQHEVNQACKFLEMAVLALHDMIANLSNEELELVMFEKGTANPLKDASDAAKSMKCIVPRSLPISGGKPACLITFGDHDNTMMHPAPDPLLLVLRAANTFGIMARMQMLASAIPNDSDDVSIGDIMAEEAFLEAREQSFRPNTWADLARGLGQRNGYFVAIGKNKASC